MAAVGVLCLVMFLAMTGHSGATYCICNAGLSDAELQKDIDYACGHGADCSQILPNGSCYNPNTVKDHCNYAVNSYYQMKNQAPDSCNFSGTATTAQAVPNPSSGCVYPSGSSPSTTPGTPAVGITPSTTPTTPATGTTPSTTTPNTPTTGITPSTSPSIFGLGPTAAGTGGTTTIGNMATVTTLHQRTLLLWSLTLTLLLSGPLFARA